MPAPAKKPEPKKPDRIELRLFNTIAIYDDYIVGKTPEAAREALLSLIASGECKPSEIVTRESTMAHSIRASKVDESPWVAADISDDEFESLKGITNGKAFERFYQRR